MIKILITLILIWLIGAAISLCIEWYNRPNLKPVFNGKIIWSELAKQMIATMVGILAILLSPLVWVYKKLRGKE